MSARSGARWPRWREAAVSLGLLLVLLGIAVAYYVQRDAALDQRARVRFSANSSLRNAELVGRLNAERRVLTALTAFFAGSEMVSQAELRAFVDGLGPEDTVAACFADPSTGERISWSRVDASICDAFDPLEPTRVFDQPERIILSSFATTRSKQKGYLSVVFNLRSLFPTTLAPGIDEFLIVSDTINNSARTYVLSPGGGAVQVAEHIAGNRQLFDVAQFGPVHFFHLTTDMDRRGAGRRELLITFGTLVALACLAALFFANLLTSRRRIAAEVEERTAELSQFAYRTSHDLRGPLLTVRGLCQAMQEDLDDGETEAVAEHLSRVIPQVERLDRLVIDILDLARADLDEQIREPLDLTALAEEACSQAVATFAPDASVTTEVRADPPGQRYLLPRARIAQILDNLISNSVKYRHPERDARVDVEIRHHQTTLDITIRDNGLGIPEDLRDRAFGMFQRFHPDVATTGSGLGLFIVKKHVERLGGTTRLTSSPDGTVIAIALARVVPFTE